MAKERGHERPNRLISEKSPYLLQHAYNPVDWFPWADEAFEKAALEDRPIFLSVGYSTCHWCHVMEKESFEDNMVAELLNSSYICIKVDREERPDIDHIYMSACMLMTGSGGWPLTIIMTPDKRPFFAGTYFPKEGLFGRPGMIELLPLISRLWTTDRKKAIDAADQLAEALKSNERQAGRAASIPVPVGSAAQSAFENLDQLFDKEHGGFGNAPKFPTPHILTFLVRFAKRTSNAEALRMVRRTLDSMRNGGIYDHIGYGFHRYSTDAEWLVPHFEKMLYDQAMLCLAYTDAYEITGDNQYRKTAEEILEYVLRDLTTTEGVFCSGEDADSEGEEGKFYVWHQDDIQRVLGSSEAALASDLFGIEDRGNFIDHLTGERPGTNIFHIRKTPAELSASSGIALPELDSRISDSISRLLTERSMRTRPHRDDKILADWNGLMISAFARAARIFGNSSYADTAVKAASFIIARMRREDGRLMHRFRDNEPAIPGFLDDHAFMTAGLIDLYIATADEQFLHGALFLKDILLRHFRDADGGGFFFTSDDAEPLLLRSRITHDSAVPAGNSIALLCMLRLSAITGDEGLRAEAENMIRLLSAEIGQAPEAFTSLLHAALYEPSDDAAQGPQ